MRADTIGPLERMSVLPRPLVEEALARPVTRRLIVTDVGIFSEARMHETYRPNGASETIIIACASGSGWVEIGGVRHGVGAGSVLVVPAEVPNGYGSSKVAPWTIWWCHLRGTDLPELIAATGATVERPVLALQSIERCIGLIDEIVRMTERDLSPARMMAASGTAWKLLTQIALDRALPERGDPLQRAMSYLEDNLDVTIRIPDLAAMVGISPSHLSALFSAATGGGVLAHQISLRMSRARQLLDRSTLGIADIAREIGYEDPLYFSRLFRRTHGMSPTQYRGQRKG